MPLAVDFPQVPLVNIIRSILQKVPPDLSIDVNLYHNYMK